MRCCKKSENIAKTSPNETHVGVEKATFLYEGE